MQGLRLGGHPLHPALVHFPVVCWTATPFLYGVYLLRRDLAFWRYAFWCDGMGVAMAILAMSAGFMDLLAIPAKHPAQATGQRHMLLMASAWCIYTVVLVACPVGVTPTVTRACLGLGLSLAGFALLGIGAYAGARLVYDFGIGQTGVSRKTASP